MAKIIISILLLLFSIQSHSQIAMWHSHNQNASVDTLILDSVSNALAAFSFQKLKTSYTGNCIRVRRSSDNTTSDIGFVNNYLDTSNLKSFIGSSSGFVLYWYDQSDNIDTAKQLTNSKQPRIANAGNLEYQNGEVTLLFDGTDDALIIAGNSISGLSNFMFLGIADYKIKVTNEMLFTHDDLSGTNGVFDHRAWASGDAIFYVFGAIGNGASGLSITNTERLYTFNVSTNAGSAKINNTDDGTFTSTIAMKTTSSIIGARSDGFFFGGNVKEVILFNANMSSQQTQIINNRNRNYSIF